MDSLSVLATLVDVDFDRPLPVLGHSEGLALRLLMWKAFSSLTFSLHDDRESGAVRRFVTAIVCRAAAHGRQLAPLRRHQDFACSRSSSSDRGKSSEIQR